MTRIIINFHPFHWLRRLLQDQHHFMLTRFQFVFVNAKKETAGCGRLRNNVRHDKSIVIFVLPSSTTSKCLDDKDEVAGCDGL